MTSKQKFDRALTLVSYSGSANNFALYVAESAINKEKLYEDIRQCRLDQRKCRFDVWKMLMGVCSITGSLQQKIQQLNNQRQHYQAKKSEAYTSVAIGGKKQNPIPKNPLMKAMVKSPKVQQVDDSFLKDQIRKDVQRTYQQYQFFQEQSILKLLSTILFVWCKRNPEVSYKQGMNEVLASIVYVYFQEAYAPSRHPEGIQHLNQELTKAYLHFNNIQFAEADIYCVFQKIMNIQNQMYKTQTDSNLKGVINPNSKNNTPILQRIITIIDQKLKTLDIQLFRAIKLQDVQTKTFLLRWIRCMHTRQFSLENSFIIWDSIFLDYCQWPSSKEKSQFQFIDAMCVAMFVYMRSIALTRQTAYQILQIYQKYPNLKKGGYLEQLISLAWSLCQALRQPTNPNSADWVGQQNTKVDGKIQLIKSKDPILKQQEPVVIQKPKQKIRPTQQNKELKHHETNNKPTQKQPEQKIQKFDNTFEVQHRQQKQALPDLNFTIVLAPNEWQLLVEKLQKSLALNNDEQSRKFTLQGIQILKSKVQSISHSG